MRNALLVIALAVATATAQTPPPSDVSKLDEETLRHFQALVRFDTSDPPGNEQPAADYLKKVLEADGIPVRDRLRSSPPPQRGRAPQGQRRSGRCSSWDTPTSSTSIRRSGRIRPSAPRATAGTSTAAARWTTRTISSPALMVMLHAEAAERAARSRRHLSRRVRRGGFDARRHPVHGRASTSRRSRPSTASPKAGACRGRPVRSSSRRSRRSRRFRAPSN